MAAVLNDVLGRLVRHVDLPIWAFLRALRVMGRRFGIDAFQLTGVRWYYQEQKAGPWEVAAPTTHVRDLTGREPEDFTTIARRYTTRPDVRRTPANPARVLWDMTRITVTRSHASTASSHSSSTRSRRTRSCLPTRPAGWQSTSPPGHPTCQGVRT